jgi:hypothetical protein
MGQVAEEGAGFSHAEPDASPARDPRRPWIGPPFVELAL